ncbi:MarR family transcriptional regulator [Peptococcaceae bacterium 1198_IL3148]
MVDKRQVVIELGNLMNQVAKESNCQLKKLLGQLESSITPSQYIILKVIESNSNCKAADIAQMLDISPAATTNVLDRLCHGGWIERIRSDKDRRVVWLKLTAVGQQRLKAIDEKKVDLMMEQFKNITEEETVFVKKIFEKLLQKQGGS